MGINFEGLSPESKAKLQQIMSDNVVTGKEVQGLNAAEQEALSSLLGGKLPDVGEQVTLSKRHVGEAEAKPQKSWAQKLGIAAAVVAGTTALGAAIGGIAGFFGGGVGAVPGAIAGAKLGAIAGAALVGLSSCGEDTYAPEIISDDDYNITVNVTQKYDELVKLLKEIIAGREEDSAKIQELIDILRNQGQTLDAILQHLIKQGVQLSDILDLLKETSITQEEILDAVTNGNEEIKNYMSQILSLVNSGVQISQKNTELLDKLINLVGSMQPMSGTELSAAFEKLFNLITASIEQNTEMDEKTYNLLSEILTNIEKGNEADIHFYKTILERMDSYEDDMKTYLTNILEAVNNGNAISEDIKNLTMKVLEQINNGAVANNDALKAILEAISNIKVEGGNVDLSTVEKMLAELLDQSKSNGELLSSIDGKLDVINMSITTAKEEILNKLGEGFDKTNQHYKNIEATLNDIVNNAGAGFDDSEILGHLELILKSIDKLGEKFTDKSELLEKLDEILAAIKDHKVIVDVTGKVTCECNCGDSGSHEGIVGDLSDLLG